MHTFGCTNDVVSFADSELGNGLGCYVGIFIARSLCVVHCLGLTHWFLIAAAPLPLPLPFGLSDTNHRSNIIQYCSFARPCNAIKSRMRTNHLDSKKCERGTQNAQRMIWELSAKLSSRVFCLLSRDLFIVAVQFHFPYCVIWPNALD